LDGLGGKLGIDATNKIGSETSRQWGRPLMPDPAVIDRVDRIWSQLGLDRENGQLNGSE
jgi:4-hydroxy-3-polyprenylbenzoate decarboxylase